MVLAVLGQGMVLAVLGQGIQVALGSIFLPLVI